jgi:hypothetical protein
MGQQLTYKCYEPGSASNSNTKLNTQKYLTEMPMKSRLRTEVEKLYKVRWSLERIYNKIISHKVRNGSAPALLRSAQGQTELKGRVRLTAQI